MSKFGFSGRAALARALIGALGGYVLAISFMSAGSGVLLASGIMRRADALASTGMLAFLVWTSALLVAFGAATTARAAAWVLGAALGFALVGWASLSLAGAA
ncbi:iron transporter [Massilia violaceinigra]|uniref:Iron transporter n=1 Tax=Massilia violaceinigra TaxID=2045208 RepID=A0ABY4A7X8_9BURK|nr:iron transporter [Massilia violaceinigra]UOD29681.1 iron transporter [Massilia violaceinigra]